MQSFNPPAQDSSQERPAVEWFALARISSLLSSVLLVGFYATVMVRFYQRLLLGGNIFLPGTYYWTVNQLHEALRLLGQPVTVYAIFSVALTSWLTLEYVAAAMLIFWKKPNDHMALYVSFTLVLFGTGFPPVIELMTTEFHGLPIFIAIWENVGFTLLFILYYCFPDGRFVPRWTRWAALFWVIANAISTFWPNSHLVPFNLPEPFGSLFSLVILGSFVFALMYRYRHAASPVQRQQTKWVVVGMLGAMGGFMITWFGRLIFPALQNPTPAGVLYNEFETLLLSISFGLIPLTLGFAILRYRLWDIDLFIRRTLVYTILTGGLLLVYGAIVIVLQGIFWTTTGETSSLALVASTLATAALFNPMRLFLQRWIDRSFHRSRVDSMRLLARLSTALRNEVNFDCVASSLTDVVKDAFNPEQVILWIRPMKNVKSDSSDKLDQIIPQARELDPREG